MRSRAASDASGSRGQKRELKTYHAGHRVCVCAVCCRCRRAPSPLEHVQDFSIFADGGHWFRVSDFAQSLGVPVATVVESVRRHLVKDRGGARFGLCSLRDEWYVQAWRCVLCGRCLGFFAGGRLSAWR